VPPNDPDRRRAVRRVPQPTETLSRMRLRTGRELAVVDISPAGALVEGATRLLPGTHVEVHVVTRHGRLLVRTRVVRSSVWQLQADAVSYRTALAFDAAVDTEVDGYPLPTETPVIEGGAGSPYPRD
jgi:PilZ domain